jgi:hypothetical protein
MQRFGQDGLALLAENIFSSSTPVNQFLLLRGPFVAPQELATEGAATLASSSSSSIAHGSNNVTLTLTGSHFLPGVAATWNGAYRTTTIVDSTHVKIAIPASDLSTAGTASIVATNPGAPASNALQITINEGRFMSGDSGVDQDVEDPQSWNLYGYVRNNPLTNVDPDGHDCVVQSRIDDTHESITVSSGDCKGKGTGSGQSATYVPGTVTGISVNGGNSIDIGYNSYDGQSSGVTNSRGAPAFDHPGIDGPANAAIFGQIGNQGMGAIQWFGEQMAWNVAGGLAGHGVGLAVDAFRASRAAGALAEVLAKAGSAVGNTGMKVASREVAEQAAKEWVGEGAEPIYANRGAGQQVGWKSADGTKVARFTSADTKGYINLENRTTGSNLHVRW